MKIHLKFNHKKDDVLEAIDCQHDSDTVNDMLQGIIREYIINENIESHSQLCELMHKKLDYEIILFAAMHSVVDKVGQAEIDLIKTGFKKFLEDEGI